jgi:hypothetical protein
MEGDYRAPGERTQAMNFRVPAFLALLAVPQAYAFVAQVAGGYRPFVAAPAHVPLSWDMFTGRIERCEVVWSPPLPDGTFSLRQHGTLLEWPYALSSVENYRSLIRWTCVRFRRPFVARYVCFTPDGKETAGADRCE